MTTLSVLIVTYNSAPQLPACLNSLRGQTLQDFEVIVAEQLCVIIFRICKKPH